MQNKYLLSLLLIISPNILFSGATKEQLLYKRLLETQRRIYQNSYDILYAQVCTQLQTAGAQLASLNLQLATPTKDAKNLQDKRNQLSQEIENLEQRVFQWQWPRNID